MKPFIVSLIATVILTPLAIRYSHKNNLLDHPKKGSIHINPIPVLGGVVVFIVFFAVNFFSNTGSNLTPLFLASIPLIASGVYDDMKGLSAGWKLLIQFISVVTLISFGIIIEVIRAPFGPLLGLGNFSIPVTIVWFIFMINLVNLLDGLDGLAAGLCTIVFLFLFIITPFPYIDTQLAVLIGSTLGLLVFNFNPAKIFLGNSGSSFLGLLVGYYSLVTSQKSTVMPVFVLPLGIFLVQIFDVGAAIYRRLKNGKSIFKGDKHHVHHLALHVIGNHRMTVLLFYLVSLISAFISLRMLTRA